MPSRETNRIIKNIRNEEAKRYSLPKVYLSKLEKSILEALAEGRDIREIDFALKMNNNNSCINIIYRILNKLEAFTVPHAIAKAIALNRIKPVRRYLHSE